VGNSRYGLVRIIGAFKLVKATLLIALGLGGLLSVPQNVAAFARHAIRWMGAFPGHSIVRHAIGRMGALDEATAEKLGVVALAYAAVFLVEGIGLLCKKRWAEWMTVGVTASFVPVEVYELAKHFTAGKVVALMLNVAIVIYLIWHRMKEHRRLPARLARVVGAI
jgi:uncharacterized membrane protein (DUF2068 family)